MKENHPTKDLKEFIKAIIETKSKEEEDNIIRRGLETLKNNIAKKAPSNCKMMEYCLRAIYSDMLGHNVAFSHVFAIKMIENKSIHVKRIGYLASTLMLSADSDLKILLVASLQKDLASPDDLVVSCALNAFIKLVNESFAAALVPSLLKLFERKTPIVKKKLLMALHRIESLAPNSVPGFADKLKQQLLETDFSVIHSAVSVVLEESQHHREAYASALRPLNNILKQIIDKKMGYYDYQKIPEPYLQLKILKVFAVLAKNDERLSEEVYGTVEKCLARADNLTTDVSYALVYESILTICSLYHNKGLLDLASFSISKFLKRDQANSNMVYLGITALKHLTQIDPAYLDDHQFFVLNCLESSDETIKRITLDLLCKNASPNNIETITNQLTQMLLTATDNGFKQDLTHRIFELAVKEASDIGWFVRRFFQLLSSTGHLLTPDMVKAAVRIFEENFADNPEFGKQLTDEVFRLVSSSAQLNDNFVKVFSWVVGHVSLKVDRSADSLGQYFRSLRYVYEARVGEEHNKVWVLDAMQALSREPGFGEREELLGFLSSQPTSACMEVNRKISEIGNRELTHSASDFEQPQFDFKMSFLLDFANSRKGRFYNPETSERICGFRSQKSVFNELKWRNDDPVVDRREEPEEGQLGKKGVENPRWTPEGFVEEKTVVGTKGHPQGNPPQASSTKPGLVVAPSETEPRRVANPRDVGLFNRKNDFVMFPDGPKTPEHSVPEQREPREPRSADFFDDTPPARLPPQTTPQTPPQTTPPARAPNSQVDFFDSPALPTPPHSSMMALDIDENQYQQYWEAYSFEKEGSVVVTQSVNSFLNSKGFRLVSQDEDDFISAGLYQKQVVLLYLNRVERNKFSFTVKAEKQQVVEQVYGLIHPN